jgi:hypothetical protein
MRAPAKGSLELGASIGFAVLHGEVAATSGIVAWLMN